MSTWLFKVDVSTPSKPVQQTGETILTNLKFLITSHIEMWISDFTQICFRLAEAHTPISLPKKLQMGFVLLCVWLKTFSCYVSGFKLYFWSYIQPVEVGCLHNCRQKSALKLKILFGLWPVSVTGQKRVKVLSRGCVLLFYFPFKVQCHGEA